MSVPCPWFDYGAELDAALRGAALDMDRPRAAETTTQMRAPPVRAALSGDGGPRQGRLSLPHSRPAQAATNDERKSTMRRRMEAALAPLVFALPGFDWVGWLG